MGGLRGAANAGFAGIAGSRDRGLWPVVCWGRRWGRRPAVSAGRGLERLVFLERGVELGCPGPGVLEVWLGAPAGEREPAATVQQPVAQPLGFGLGEFAVEDERLGPDSPVVRERHDLRTHLV